MLTIRKISVVEVMPPKNCPIYDFTKGTHGWTSYRNAVGKVTAEGLQLTIKGTHANLANYNLNLDPASCQALEVTFKAENYPNNIFKVLQQPHFCGLYALAASKRFAKNIFGAKLLCLLIFSTNIEGDLELCGLIC